MKETERKTVNGIGKNDQTLSPVFLEKCPYVRTQVSL